MLLAMALTLGLSLVGVAVISAVAYLLFHDARVDAATVGTPTDRPRASVDPNEAARAAGSWG